MIPANEHTYTKQCWRCKCTYSSKSSFLLELCENCWAPLENKIMVSFDILFLAWAGIPLWTSPLWIRLVVTGEYDNRSLIMTSLFLGSILSWFWGVCSALLILLVSAGVEALIGLRKQGWFDWIPLVFSRRGKQ